MLDLRESMLPIYATPIVNTLWQDVELLNQSLYKAAIKLEQQETGLVKSNIGGWHSDLNFLNENIPAIQEFKQRLSQYIQEFNQQISNSGEHAKPMRLEAWANISRKGHYNSIHNHPNAYWSGVYYITGNPTVDEHPFSGKLELIDPRPAASVAYDEDNSLYGRFLLNPLPGQIILFPAWLQHQVHPYFGEEPRISIAFNALI